jgi:hypothetical protein
MLHKYLNFLWSLADIYAIASLWPDSKTPKSNHFAVLWGSFENRKIGRAPFASPAVQWQEAAGTQQ